MRAIATLLLAAHVAAFAAPTLAEARASEGEMAMAAHCAPAPYPGDLPAVDGPRHCDGCDMPDCPGMANCATQTVAVVSGAEFTQAPAVE